MSNKLFVFNPSNCFSSNTFVSYFVTRNDSTQLPAINIFNNSLNLLTTNIFTKYLMDVTQLRIIHRLSPAWLVSLQDLSAGIAVPGLLTRGSSSTKLARHAFQDLGVSECTFLTIKHHSYKHRPKKLRTKNWVCVWEIYILIHLSCSDAKRWCLFNRCKQWQKKMKLGCGWTGLRTFDLFANKL